VEAPGQLTAHAHAQAQAQSHAHAQAQAWRRTAKIGNIQMEKTCSCNDSGLRTLFKLQRLSVINVAAPTVPRAAHAPPTRRRRVVSATPAGALEPNGRIGIRATRRPRATAAAGWTHSSLDRRGARGSRWNRAHRKLRATDADGRPPSGFARATLGGGSPALADLQLPLLVDAEVILEKPAEFPQPMLHEEQRLRGTCPARGKLLNLRAQVADLAHLVHMTLVVNRVQAEQVG
jgi:hypothetical protein